MLNFGGDYMNLNFLLWKKNLAILDWSDKLLIMDTDLIAGNESGLGPILVFSSVTTRNKIEQYPSRPRLILECIGEISLTKILMLIPPHMLTSQPEVFIFPFAKSSGTSCTSTANDLTCPPIFVPVSKLVWKCPFKFF